MFDLNRDKNDANSEEKCNRLRSSIYVLFLWFTETFGSWLHIFQTIRQGLHNENSSKIDFD